MKLHKVLLVFLITWSITIPISSQKAPETYKNFKEVKDANLKIANEIKEAVNIQQQTVWADSTFWKSLLFILQVEYVDSISLKDTL